MAPPSRRRILPPETLAAFGAALLFPPALGAVGDGASPASPSAPPPPTQRAPTTPAPWARAPSGPPAASDDVPPPHGIRIGGWNIVTQNSSIGGERRMEELTSLLEEAANEPSDNGMGEDDAGGGVGRKRRLCPPEITFPDATISFQRQSPSESDEMAENGSENTAGVRFTARDALLEWAEAHQRLEMHQDHSHHSTISLEECRGVSILKTIDAKAWSAKPPSVDAATAAAGHSEFYYDWTYSSPYAGTIVLSRDESPAEARGDTNHRTRWKPLRQSHIPFHMLQDTTQPILLYDDIHLYEDDLHDNGDVSLNIKVRVMPRCWYVLQRLFVRVDRVCVRCREVRYFCLFDDTKVTETDVRQNAIYRDAVWREARWEELVALGLPADPAAWREENVSGATVAGAPTPSLAALLARLPAVPLPDDLPRFSYFSATK